MKTKLSGNGPYELNLKLCKPWTMLTNNSHSKTDLMINLGNINLIKIS